MSRKLDYEMQRLSLMLTDLYCYNKHTKVRYQINKVDIAFIPEKDERRVVIAAHAIDPVETGKSHVDEPEDFFQVFELEDGQMGIIDQDDK